MQYSDFRNLRSIRQKLCISVHFTTWLPACPAVEPSALLVQLLERYTRNRTAYFNEKSRSEGIVFPVLSELQYLHNFSFALYSGANIEGEKDLGLNGECDFVLSNSKQSIEVESPIFCVVEAKDNDLELGIPQCIAQLCGVDLYNKKVENKSLPILYGAVTTGTEWNFLKKEGTSVYIDSEFYPLKNLSELLGVLNYLIENAIQNATLSTTTHV
jgi:hypothetical protein